MATIFLSHASANDPLANSLVDWMAAHGFADVFVDHKSIEGGEKWDDALARSAGSCRVVICLVTDAWLASLECFSEFRAARYGGKRILPLFLTDDPKDGGEAADRWQRITAEDQGIDIGSLRDGEILDFNRNDGVANAVRTALRAAGALAKIGLDPEAFAIDRDVRDSPFPGLASFGDDDADAAIFFGRSREIALALEKLRKSRADGDRTPLMILGASGSGKSSLLKAGVIPRLRRETPAWLPLRAFRPGADPLYNFADAFARTLADYGQREAPGAIRRSLLDAWRAAPKDESGARSESGWRSLLDTLNAFGARVKTAANRDQATLLLSIDQAEELARSEGESGEALSDFLRAALIPEGAVDWRLAFTIRSDSLPELLRDPRFEGLDKNGITLRALPVFRFADVVEEPARRYGVEIDPDLVHMLAEDAPDSDALPLLAFALQRLWRGFGDAGRIRAADYQGLGRLAGMIEDAAERALNGIGPGEDKALPKTTPKSALTLAEKTFVPPLAQINDEGEAIRRVAPWSEFSDDAQALLDGFSDWRLVVRKTEDAGDTIEVAHEALFREWERLKNWLEPERARLDALRALHVASAAWERENRKPAFLTHFGQRLLAAVELTELSRYAARLSETDRAYVAACAAADRRSARRRLLLQGSAAALGFAIVLGSLGFAFQFEIEREWTRQMAFAPFARSAEDLAALEDLAAFRECRDDVACPEMVVIPAGSFTMGSPESEEGSFDSERPQREVTIARFAIGRTEVTHDDWRACVDGTDQSALLAARQDDPTAPVVGCAPIGDSGFGVGGRPAINVSWYDAKGYVAWLNDMTAADPANGPYRLPTEAEWEYAARSGTETAYSWGADSADICSYANVANPDTQQKYSLRWDVVDCPDNFLETSPTASFKPNLFDLYDMHGNVFEWTEDCWHESYHDAPTDGAAWMEASGGDCSRAVLRGGSWGYPPVLLRSAFRIRDPRVYRVNYIGFRVSRTLAE